MKEPGLKTKVLRKIEEISPEEWNSVFPDVLEGYHFFKTLEQSRFDQFSFRYILVYDNKTLVGATVSFLMSYALDTTVQGSFGYFTTAVKKIFPNIFNLRVLICGLPMGQGRIGIGAEGAGVVRAIHECLEQIAKEEKVSIIAFKDFGQNYAEILDQQLRPNGFHKIESMPNTEMDIRFTNFDEYLKSLSRVSRDGVKRKFKKVDGRVKIELEVTNELNGALDDVHKLYLQTAAKAEVNLEHVPKDFFQNISKNMPVETKYFLWRMDNKLVAFAFCLVSKDRFIDYYLGFDYSVAYDYHLYFIRFRDLMNWCIANKIPIYEMGNTSYEPKRRLGFDFIPLYVYVKHRNKWINPLFKLLCTFLKPENFDPVLKDMKKKEKHKQLQHNLIHEKVA